MAQQAGWRRCTFILVFGMPRRCGGQGPAPWLPVAVLRAGIAEGEGAVMRCGVQGTC